MSLITTSRPRRRARHFTEYEDRKTTSFFISSSLWNQFGDYCRMHSIGRSKLIELLILEEMRK